MSLSVPNLQQLASGLPLEVQTALRSALSAQDRFNRDVATFLDSVTTPVWYTPVLTHGWVAYSDARTPRYTKLATGLVVISGDIKSGTVGSPCFYLPEAYRPTNIDLESFGVWTSSATFGRLYIFNGDGSVTPGSECNNIEVNVSVSFMGPP